MDSLRPADLVARVVAWHNRHPLARRIAPAHVTGVGALSLPMALREPAADGAVDADASLTPICDTHWMYGANDQALDRFVAVHGVYPLEAAAHWPWRHVDADLPRARAADARGLEGRTARHLLTAVIEADGRRSRVLVAPALPLTGAAVFGRRLYSLPRLAGGVGSAAAATSAALAAMVFGGAAAPADDGGVPAIASAASAAAAMARGAVAPAAAAPAASAPVSVAAAPASAAASGADSAIAADTADLAPEATVAAAPALPAPDFRPVDVQPMLQDAAAAGPLVHIRPTLTEDERRQARVQAEALRPPPGPTLDTLLKGPVYALATPPLRTRDDAQAQQVLLHGLKAQVATPVPTQLDVMPAGRRWRVVWWPHPQADEVERLRVEASTRGLELEVIAF